MIDPVSCFAIASAAISTAKKIADTAGDVQSIFEQLGKFAQATEDLRAWAGMQDDKPPIFKKLTFDQSETKEALNALIVKQRLTEFEKTLREEFLYGSFERFGGLDGYKEFIALRREIAARREQLLYAQLRRRQELLHKLTLYGAIGGGLAVVVSVVWWATDLVIRHAK